MDWSINDYQIGTIGHELQQKIDSRLYAQMQEQVDRIEALSTRIAKLNKMIAEFEHRRNEDRSQPVDISELAEMIEEFRSIWEEFQKEFPIMKKEEFPFPSDLDLTKVDQKLIDRVEGNIESMKMRYQNKIPVIMEQLNAASALYKILAEICAEIAKTAREEKNHIVRRQVQG